MLHYETIDTTTLELLKSLQAKPEFSQLRLVGGTSLALQYGHRKSIDIDLFGVLNIDEIELHKSLSQFDDFKIIHKTKNITVCTINGIKTDIVNYPYPWIEEPITTDGILLADPKDIAAMKLSAVTGRGSKKDFFDIVFLLNHFSLSEMMSFYEAKFHDGSKYMVLKSLLYFEDAEKDKDPQMLVDLDWDQAKKQVISSVKEYQSL